MKRFPITMGLNVDLNPLITSQEMRELAKKLFENMPGQTCSWDVMHEDVQKKWIEFAKFIYGTIMGGTNNQFRTNREKA